MAASAETPAPQRVGTLPAVPGSAVKTTDPAGDTPLDLSISLHSRDEAGATALAAEVADRTSPHYRQFLRTGEFAQRFGADPATVAKVTQALKDQGLNPGALGADGLTIPVRTTVAAAKKAFDIGMAGYRLADGSSGYLNTAAPAIRGDVAGEVTSVVGLNSLARVKSHHTGGGKSVPATPTAKGQFSSAATGSYPQLCQSVRDQLANAGYHDGQNYFSPASLAKVYGLDNLSDGGAGTTVAIFSLEAYSDAAVQTFQNCYSTSATVDRVSVNAGTQAPPDNNNVGVESALDIDTIIGLAPKAHVKVYEGPDAANATNALVQATYRQIVSDNSADVISSSWGVCDQVVAASDLVAEQQIFRQAALQGQTVVAASGDNGSSSCANLNTTDTSILNRQSADDPSGQPFVTGVGGTTLTGSLDSPSETVWNHDGGASGGGITRWAMRNDRNFQAGFTGPGFDNSFCGGNPATQTCRQSPDVSAVADPATGYLIATGQNNWMTIGGTSGAAPLWAALAAHANSSGKCSGRVGLLNNALYQAARLGQSPLKDITSGNNDIGPQGGKFAAVPGYDMATGLGTPKAAQVIDKVCPPSGTYMPVAPQRIMDTRNGTGTGTVRGMNNAVLQVGGKAGVPTSGVTAVVLNVTVADTANAGYLTAYPYGTARPLSSNLNWVQGQVIPNLVTVPVGTDGKVSLFNGSLGTADLVADVAGYYSTTAAGAQLKPISPTRIMDTRNKTFRPTVPGKGEVALQVVGKAGVPSGATAAVLNITVTDTAGPGYLTAYPYGTNRPTASNVNWSAGQTIPNAVIVPIGADGKVSLFNGSPFGTDIVVDIAGYFSPTVSGGRFHVAGPARQVDTRTDLSAPLSNGQTLPVLLRDSNSRVPYEATSVVLNVTVTGTTAPGYLTVWPADGSSRPLASNLNWVKGNTIANLVTVPAYHGKVDLAAFGAGTTNVIVDLFGYYSN